MGTLGRVKNGTGREREQKGAATAAPREPQSIAEAGVSVDLIQKHLGHEHRSTTERNYIAPASLDKARQNKVLQVLTGGKQTAA